MKENYSSEHVQDVLNALDKAIQDGPWEASNFLRILGNRLKALRDAFAEEQGLGVVHQKNNLHQEAIQRKRSTMIEIFVGLYTSEGGQLQSWERILANLPKQMISRPIYALEQDIQAAIKSKENRANEAYVTVFIQETDKLILPPEKIPKDRLGKALICLKDRAIDLSNVGRFVHLGIEYEYVKGRLVKKIESPKT